MAKTQKKPKPPPDRETALERAKARLVEIAAERKKAVAERQIEKYKPYPFQVEAHNASDNHRYRAIIAANRVGKTVWGATDITFHATGNYPDWYRGRRFDKPINAWVCGRTNLDLRDILQHTLLGKIDEDRRPKGTGWIPKHLIGTVTFRQCGVSNVVDEVQVKHVSGEWSTIGFRSFEQGDAAFQGVARQACIAEGELVQMADGTMRPIEDVCVGDSVLSLNGNGKPFARKVVAVHDNGVRECCEIELKHGPVVTLTPCHKVYWGYMAKSHCRADQAEKIAQICPETFWPNETHDRDDAWYVWTALAVAEGSYKSQKITNGNESIMERAISLLGDGIRVRKKDFINHDHVPDWYLYWPEFWKELGEGVSSTKSIPDWIFTSSKEKVRLFVRWLYAGDGWANGHSIGYATTSRVLATQLHVLLSRLGIRPSGYIRKSKNENWKNQHWVMISRSNDVERFLKEIGIEGKDTACNKVLAEAQRRIESKKQRGTDEWRKQNYRGDKARLERNRVRVKASKVRRITKTDKRRVYDLSVEGEHRYLVGTSLVSNCWFDEEPDNDPNNRLFAEANVRLMDSNGIFLFTRTPLMGATEIVRHFMSGAPGTWYKNVTWDDVPHLSKEIKDEFLANTPEFQRDARSKGIPALGTGAVYKVAQSEYVCEPLEHGIPNHFRRIVGVDFGLDHYAAAVWVAYDADADIVYVYDCYRAKDQTAAYHVSRLNGAGSWIPVAWPHDGLQRGKADGVSLMEQYRKCGANMTGMSARHSDERGGGQSREVSVGDILERMRTRRLKVYSTCTDLLEELRMLHRDDNGRIVAKKDDLESALRYAVMSLRWGISKTQSDTEPSYRSEDRDAYDPFACVTGV